MAREESVVLVSTSMGNIRIELDADKAPISTKNFLDYASAGTMTGLIFHRVIPVFMIQAAAHGRGYEGAENQRANQDEPATV